MFDATVIQEFNDLEFMIYNYIMKNSEKVLYMRIRELAEEVHVSTTTILRFCKKVQCDGFSEFKVKWKLELQKQSSLVHDDLEEVMNSLKRLQQDDYDYKIEEVARLAQQSKTIIFVGVGNSGAIAHYGSRYFANAHAFSLFIEDPFFPVLQHTNALEDCLVIALSVSGETEELIEQIHGFKSAGIKVVSITCSANCTLSKLSDVNIAYYASREREKLVDFTTQIPVLYIIESIAKRIHNLKIQS